jgi:quinolinate synthase
MKKLTLRIELPEEILRHARLPIERMLEFRRGKSALSESSH